jgi:hypothetical protein
VAIDHSSKKVLSFLITNDLMHDSEVFEDLYSKMEDLEILVVLGDKGYDSRSIYWFLEDRDVDPVIRPRKNAITTGDQPPSRITTVDIVKTKSYREWCKETGYGRRWSAETFFSAFKRLFGEYVKAKTLPGMIKELIMKLYFYNKFLSK